MRNEHWSTISSVVSAVCALIAVTSAVWIHWDSVKEERYYKRPILSLFDSVIHVKPKSNGDIRLEQTYIIKNFGRSIAESVKIRIFSAPLSKPEKLKEIADDSMANDLLPETTFSRDIGYTIHINNSSLNLAKMSAAMILVIDYYDPLNDKKYTINIWMINKLDEKGLFHMDTKTRDIFKPELLKLLN